MLDRAPEPLTLRKGCDELGTHLWVQLHQVKLIFGQGTRLVQNCFRKKQFAYIVEPGGSLQVRHFLFWKIEGTAHQLHTAHDALTVPSGVSFAVLRSARQRLKRVPQNPGMAVIAHAADANERGHGFLHMLGTGMIALEKPLHEGSGHLPLDRNAFIGGEEFHFRYAISASML